MSDEAPFSVNDAKQYVKDNAPFTIDDAKNYVTQNAQAQLQPKAAEPTPESFKSKFGKWALGAALPATGLILGEAAGGALGGLSTAGAGIAPGAYAGGISGAIAGKKADQYIRENYLGEKISPEEKAAELRREALYASVPLGVPILKKAITEAPMVEAATEAIAPTVKSVTATVGNVASKIGSKAAELGSKAIEYLPETAEAIGAHAGGLPGLIIGKTGGKIAQAIAPATFELAQKALLATKTGAAALANSPEALKAATLAYINHNMEDRPTKGPSKWVADGYDNFVKHGVDIDVIGEARKNPATRDLMIQASDAKPGSKAMDGIYDKIKAKLGAK